MKNVGRRILSATILLTLVVTQVLACAGISSAATAPSGHCALTVGAAAHDCCPPVDRMNCCAVPDGDAPALPQQTQNQTSRPACGSSIAHAVDVAITRSTGCTGTASRLRTAPAHGYRSIDLPTLNASFLL